MGIRQILRTNKGVNAVGSQYGDSNVYIRRIRYTPYSATAVADAYRCTSMFACYGALAPAPVANASMVVSVTVVPPSSATPSGRRLLADSAADAQAALSAAVAAALPGVVSSTNVVTSAAAAYSISFVVTVSNLCSAPGAGDGLANFQSNGVQYGLIEGLDADLIPPASLIYVQSVTPDTSGCAVLVSLLISGYNATSVQTDYDLLTSPSGVTLISTALAINDVLGAVTAVYLTSDDVTLSTDPNYTPSVSSPPPSAEALLSSATACPSYPIAWDVPSCVDANGNPPSVWCSTCVLLAVNSINQVVTYKVGVQVAATSVGAVESAINAALLSDVVVGSAALAATPAGRRLHESGGSFNVSAPNSLLATRVAAALTVDAATCAAGAPTSAAAAPPRRGAAAAAVAAAAALLVALL
jgi:hypothetical protein